MTAGAATATKTVLVADDTAFVRDRFKAALEAAGHSTRVASTGPELVELVRQGRTRFNLIVIDLHLPQGQGLQLLRQVQALGCTSPIVIFSGTIAAAADVRELVALGVAGYINEYTAAQNILPALAPHLFPDHYRRRTSPRVALGIPIAYRFGNTIATATMVNVSNGGMAIRTTNVLQVGTTMKVHFRLPGTAHDVDADAVVRWGEHKTSMGTSFTQMTGDGQLIVDSFVEAHFFSNRRA